MATPWSPPHTVADRSERERRRDALRAEVAAGRVRRVLAVRFARLGDVLFTTPALAQLAEGLPGLALDYLTAPAAAPLVASHPAVARVLPGSPHRPRELSRTVAAGGYDAVLVFESDRPTRNRLERIARAAGVRHVVSRSSAVSSAPHPTGRHSCERHLELVDMLGLEARARPYELHVAPGDAAWAEAFLARRGLVGEDRPPLVALQAGCHYSRVPPWLLRRVGLRHKFHKLWPREHWSELARRLARRGARAVLTGAPYERRHAKAIADDVAAPPGLEPVRAAGETDVGQLAALLARVDLCISVDTGTMHVAAALGVPTLALFGPTRPSHHGPYAAPGVAQVLRSGVPCSPCDKEERRACPANRCMQEITAEQVAARAALLLARPPQRPACCEPSGR